MTNDDRDRSLFESPPAASLQTDNAVRGISLVVGAVICFTVMDAFAKWLGESYSTVQLIFFRALFGMLPVAVLLMREGRIGQLRTQRYGLHLFRAVSAILALGCFFYAYTEMALANVIAISFAAPIFITALSVPFLGEAVGIRRWSAVLVGFIGVVIMVKPSEGVFDPIALVPLGAAVFYSLMIIAIRMLTRTETSSAIVFYNTIFGILIAGLALPFFWTTPSLGDLGLMVVLGLLGGIGQITITAAYRAAPVAVLAPFDYTAMIWATAIGYFVWGEIPGVNTWTGVAIVAASGLYIVYREWHLGLPRGKARKLAPRR